MTFIYVHKLSVCLSVCLYGFENIFYYYNFTSGTNMLDVYKYGL